jgi:hypothetical protein
MPFMGGSTAPVGLTFSDINVPGRVFVGEEHVGLLGSWDL